MTKVGVLEKSIEKLEDDICTLKDRISWIDYEIGELGHEQAVAQDTVEVNKIKTKELKEQLKLVKEKLEPINGQLAFISTGYKGVVEI